MFKNNKIFLCELITKLHRILQTILVPLYTILVGTQGNKWHAHDLTLQFSRNIVYLILSKLVRMCT